MKVKFKIGDRVIDRAFRGVGVIISAQYNRYLIRYDMYLNIYEDEVEGHWEHESHIRHLTPLEELL